MALFNIFFNNFIIGDIHRKPNNNIILKIFGW